MKFFDYPAMASPETSQMVQEILSTYLPAEATILDPYCGTGRLLLLPWLHGHRILGVDCSPLAILAARVGYHSACENTLFEVGKNAVLSARKRRHVHKVSEEEAFWFQADTFRELTALLAVIDDLCGSTRLRRAMWLVFAEVVRKVSFARHEEYKLHRMSMSARAEWTANSYTVFDSCVRKMCTRLHARNALHGRGRFRFFCGDIAGSPALARRNEYDAIVTSPPYGDSRSTVGYGQVAKLPLMLLQRSARFRREFRDGNNIDSLCLGGGKCPAVEIARVPWKVGKEVTGSMRKFCEDYFGRLDIVVNSVRKNGIICLVLGDRIYQGRRFPLISTTKQFLVDSGAKEVASVERFLSWKRLPRTMQHRARNGPKFHSGMNYETIVAFQKT